MNLNRELHEALGYCWHELENIGIDESFKNYGDVFFHVCKKCGFLTDDCQEECNPNYVAEPWLVIREIEKRGCLDKFICYVCGIHHLQWNRNVTDFTKLVAIDTTGKLARLALDWLQKEEL